jgi:hypothetical protein
MPIYKKILALLLIPYVFWLVFFYRYHFIDGANLLFHEAGHVFFGFLGQTMHFLGGTIGQLVFPAACAISFYRREQLFETAVCTIWFGESMMYMAEYMGDAKTQLLPLVGGHIHDWNWLLGNAGLLDSAETLAGFVHFLASTLVIASLVFIFQKSEIFPQRA